MRYALPSCALLLVGAWLMRPMAQPQPTKGFLFALASNKISESSGVACSMRENGVYWTHNDSGDGPNFYAFDGKGADRGAFSLIGVTAVDWEDMAAARINGRPFLYIGDIGDNLGKRNNVCIYRIPEPLADGSTRAISSFSTYTCKYPDGPHNCETLLVAPDGGIQLVTKSENGESGVYILPKPEKSGKYTLRKLGVLRLEGDPFRKLATGGDMSPDGKRVVIRTYFSALLFESQDPRSWVTQKPTVIELPVERQGEGICFDIPNKRFITTSEGKPCRVSFARIP